MPATSTADEFAHRMRALRQRLQRPLPGRRAMQAMTTSNRPNIPIAAARAAGCEEACALVILYPIDGSVHTVLTLRSGSLKHHAGQVSLPGGRADPGEDAVGCALREAREELGITSHELEILGELTPIHIPPTNYCLSPVVAAASRRPAFDPHDTEVAEVIEVALDHLADESHRRVEDWQIMGETRRVPFYEVGPHKVWGATAMVLSEMVALWRKGEAT